MYIGIDTKSFLDIDVDTDLGFWTYGLPKE